MSRRKSIPELRVVFDTSALYTDSESDLLRQEVVEAIRNNSKHADLQLKWYLPAIVVDERLFQMQNKGRKFLPHIQRLEKLLGHSLNINEEVINHQIRDVVERQIKELGLEILALEVNSVDWQRVMKDVVYRVPPFEAGETEKGFRDALICESVTQLVSNSPVTPNVCRIAFMTNDGLLAKAVKNRTETATNMRVLNSLEELKSLINTLVAAISEEFVARIQEKAKAYFFEPGNKDTFFYKEKIRGQIEEKFGNKLQILPQNATYRENGNWKIQPPTFLRKEKQRVYWASRIQVEAKAYKTTLSTLPISVFSSLPPTDISLYHVSGPAYIGPEHSGLASKSENIIVSGSIVSGLVPLSGGEERAIGRFGIPPRQELIANGETVFEVTWSISVTTTGKFSSPRIENIKFIETLWE